MASPISRFRTWIAERRQLQPDEEVLFFPQSGWPSADGDGWEFDVHGWIFEREEQVWLRNLAMKLLREASEVEWAEAEKSPHFRGRCAMFLVDNERWKRLWIDVAGQRHRLPSSGPGGHFTAELALPKSVAAEGGLIQADLIPISGDQRQYKADIHLVPDEHGISVISDIDDTIKITQVRDKRAVVENTLFKPFSPVEGMAKVYQRWAKQGAAFHYVSNSPWQLFPSLLEFLNTSGFPGGGWYLNRLRIQDRSLSHFLKSSERTKPPTIASIMEHWPSRQFILVGDSGQKDPEAYGEIARLFCGRVKHIFIRSVREEDDPESERFLNAFRDIPSTDWTLFRDPSEITI